MKSELQCWPSLLHSAIHASRKVQALVGGEHRRHVIEYLEARAIGPNRIPIVGNPARMLSQPRANVPDDGMVASTARIDERIHRTVLRT